MKTDSDALSDEGAPGHWLLDGNKVHRIFGAATQACEDSIRNDPLALERREVTPSMLRGVTLVALVGYTEGLLEESLPLENAERVSLSPIEPGVAVLEQAAAKIDPTLAHDGWADLVFLWRVRNCFARTGVGAVLPKHREAVLDFAREATRLDIEVGQDRIELGSQALHMCSRACLALLLFAELLEHPRA